MIVVKIFGGLGNQLFCYAAAKALAVKTGRPLYLDLYSGFKKDFYRRAPAIQQFNIHYQTAAWWQQFQFLGGIQAVTALRKLARTQHWLHPYYYFERDYTRFDEHFFDHRASRFIYLDGYWQCERYFQDIAPLIRQEFEMVTQHDTENKEWAAKIKGVNAVALHARRLHGVPNQKNAQPKPGVRSLSLDYYQNAMAEISERVTNPHFFCFSDYPEWFEKNLKTDFNITFVSHNQYGADRSHEDFWLMSQCRHFITSNSTFSWWAAWLSRHENKIVFAPDLSFWESQDIIPRGWLTRTAS